MKNKVLINVLQAMIWALLMSYPAIVFYIYTGLVQDFVNVLKGTVMLFLPLCCIYYLNYLLLIPKLLFNKKQAWFWVANVLIIILFTLPSIFGHKMQYIMQTFQLDVVNYIKAGYVGSIIGGAALMFISMIMAIGVSYMVKWVEEKQKLDEERRHNAEAELTWLKNQLNPHFLFNTLNNISSLVAIDPDSAQDRIAQLSELLRYALYESSGEKVPVKKEVEFMENYISLMSLRCSGKTSVHYSFDDFPENSMVPPLLFICLIENAFKHGTSAHEDSFIEISMSKDGSALVFSSRNSFIEKKSQDLSGSGIGLENMKRRLQLLFPGRFTYNINSSDSVYSVTVRLDDIFTE